MDLELSDEQALLRDNLGRLLAQRYDFRARASHAADPAGWSRALWAAYAEMGLLGLSLPEEHGGSALGAVETAIVMEAFGGALALEPYLPCVVLAAGAITEDGDEAQRAAILPQIAEGRLLASFAHAEAQARHDLCNVETAAVRDDGCWRLSGTKVLVAAGDTAELLVVSARIRGDWRDRGGLGLFLLRPVQPSVTRQPCQLACGTRAASVTLDGAAAEALGTPGTAIATLERLRDRAIAALCAEAVGIMDAMERLTLDYLRMRVQFGRAIGTNQALQHRAVEMRVALEQARSMALYAAMNAGSPDRAERERAISAAKLIVGRSLKTMAQGAIQLHGGIGLTEEYAVGHYFRRAAAIEQSFGDSAFHLRRLVMAGGLLGASAA